ncbi:zinc finger protein GFI1 homolog pag-3-like [Scylla paramamosain]|uniref:zinc finger protein GFI1 homolog pag-3-like n=1 Tax=Scylla paramamosain TaxID=85552 RepID=UPI0030834142
MACAAGSSAVVEAVKLGCSVSDWQQQQQSAWVWGGAGVMTKDHQEAGSSSYKAERKFECQQCEKTMESRTGLKHHVLTHGSVGNYECPGCGKKFINKSNLTRHTLTHSGVKNYECLKYGRKFTQV